MKLKLRHIIFFFSYYALMAQNPDENSQTQLQEEADSVETVSSDLVIRIGYASKTLSAGRDFGVSQYSFTPSLTYYHQSGIYTGVTGSWYSQTDPKYNLTTLSVGYDGSSEDLTWGYTISYDRLIFNPDGEGLLKNVASIYGSRSWAHFNAGLSYSFMFASQEQASRLNPVIGGYVSFTPYKTRKWLTRISFTPTLSATLGTSNIPLSQLSGTQFSTGTGFTWEEAKELRKEYKENYPELYRRYIIYRRTHLGKDVGFVTFAAQNGVRIDTAPDTKKSFGLMCWNISVPVSFKFNRFKISVAYTYVIPRLLPDEVYETLPNQSYINVGMSYTFSKKTKASE